MSDITETLQAIARKKEREDTLRRAIRAIDAIHEHYSEINLTIAMEAVERCREAVREAFEQK